MSELSQRTANRSAFLAIGLLLVFFLIAGIGDQEGMEGLALGLMIYFIALLHVPLAMVAIGYLAVVNEWGEVIVKQVNRQRWKSLFQFISTPLRMILILRLRIDP